MEAVGEVFHSFLAADRPDLDDQARLEVATGLLERWLPAGVLEPEALPQAAEALRGWADSHWPDARWRREWPIAHRQADGSVIRGFADLVLEAEGGFVVVDHNCRV